MMNRIMTPAEMKICAAMKRPAFFGYFAVAVGRPHC